MKINSEQLKSLSFFQHNENKNINDWCHADFDYVFNQKSNKLFFINDGFNEPELIKIVKDFKDLEETMEALGYSN